MQLLAKFHGLNVSQSTTSDTYVQFNIPDEQLSFTLDEDSPVFFEYNSEVEIPPGEEAYSRFVVDNIPQGNSIGNTTPDNPNKKVSLSHNLVFKMDLTAGNHTVHVEHRTVNRMDGGQDSIKWRRRRILVFKA